MHHQNCSYKTELRRISTCDITIRHYRLNNKPIISSFFMFIMVLMSITSI